MALSCKAQSPVLPLYNNAEYAEIDGAYYKDINNDFDSFIGTWEFINGNTSFRIVLQKRVSAFIENDYYADIVVGEWRYIENGIVIVDNLANTSDDDNGIFMHSIVGNTILNKNSVPQCPECGINERRLNLMMYDPTRANIEGLAGEVILRVFYESGVAKLKFRLWQTGNITYIDGNPPQFTSLSIPWGEYILTKVP